jgi:hypothetical protein
MRGIRVMKEKLFMFRRGLKWKRNREKKLS